METNTRIKTIKVHTLVIDDTEIEAYLNDPDPLIDTLRDLLIKPAPNGNRHAPSPTETGKKRGRRGPVKQRKLPEREPCQSCGASIPAYKQGKHKCKIADQIRD